MRIVAIDPGEQTGYAFGRVLGKSLVIEDYGWLPWMQFCYRLFNTQNGDDPFKVIVYESWRLKKPKELYGSDLQSVQCVGQIKACAHWVKPSAILVTNEPSYKPVADGYMLKYGIELPTGEVEHHRDAVRHLVHYGVSQLQVKDINYGKEEQGHH